MTPTEVEQAVHDLAVILVAVRSLTGHAEGTSVNRTFEVRDAYDGVLDLARREPAPAPTVSVALVKAWQSTEAAARVGVTPPTAQWVLDLIRRVHHDTCAYPARLECCRECAAVPADFRAEAGIPPL